MFTPHYGPSLLDCQQDCPGLGLELFLEGAGLVYIGHLRVDAPLGIFWGRFRQWVFGDFSWFTLWKEFNYRHYVNVWSKKYIYSKHPNTPSLDDTCMGTVSVAFKKHRFIYILYGDKNKVYFGTQSYRLLGGWRINIPLFKPNL